MTKSSRRKDALMGKSKWAVTDKKCEECNGDMVKLQANVFVCTHCGLQQRRVAKRRFFQKSKQSQTQNPTSYDNDKFAPSPYVHCPICNKRFKSEDILKQHNLAKHHKPNVKQKRIKSKTIQTQKASLTPYDYGKLLPIPSIHCPFCNKEFKTEDALKQHTLAKHPKPNAKPNPIQIKTTPYKRIVPFIDCPLCNRKFRTESSLKQHDRAKHHKPKIADKSNILFCEKCNNLMSLSSRKNKFVCDVCGFIKPYFKSR